VSLCSAIALLDKIVEGEEADEAEDEERREAALAEAITWLDEQFGDGLA
jgi:hypothetical protein